jgi:polyferredoxin/formate hydrogenlyase subunit 6/NADH:ubiquinone oxidoreductase subunit I
VKPRHLVWIRRVTQALFLGLFLFLLAETRLPQDVYLDYSRAFSGEVDLRLETPVTFFFRLDPLVALTTLVSGGMLIQGFLWAAGVAVLTILLGRVFCGFICPFGSLHHVAGSIRPSLKSERMLVANRKAPSQRIKYFLLIGVLIAAVIGLNLAGLLDPMSFFFRSVALAVVPAIGNGLRSMFEAMALSDHKIIQLISYGGEVLVAPVFGYTAQAYQTGWFMGLLFLLILFLNRIRPRFWCRVLCPLGALLGVCSRFTLLKLEQDAEKCSGCNLCTRHCQGAASPKPGAAWETSECLMCFNCFNVCPEDALAFRFRWASALNRGPDIGRRAVLGGLLSGVALPLLGRLDGRMDKVEDPRLIRPPGSLMEADFLRTCQRCGLCMRVCPTNVINPALAEAGMSGIWTPRLIMTQGYCEYTCTLCGSVCPTGAIPPISAKEKTGRPIKIGSAYLDRGRCLPWSGNAPCIVCQEHCPTSPKAIYLKTEKVPRPDGGEITVQLPYVDLKLCVGCGICEYKCPVQGLPAIRTISAGETRSPKNQVLL